MNSIFPFLFLAILLITACEKNNDEKKQPETVTEQVKTGDWMVIFMENNAVVDLGNVFLRFNTNGSVVATKNTATYNGTWSETTNSGNSTLMLNINTTDTKLLKVNKTWKITAVKESLIDLKDSEASGNATMQLMRH